MHKIIETNRLILRTWQKSDLQPMTKINQDPKVMEYFPSPGDEEQARSYIKQIMSHYDKYGYILLSKNPNWCPNNGHKMVPNPRKT